MNGRHFAKKLLCWALAAALLSPAPALAAGYRPMEEAEAAMAAITNEDIEKEVSMAAAITPGIDLPVKSAVLMDQGSGSILYAENEDVKLPPASITKVMSLLLIMEAIDSGKIALTDKVTCSDTASGYGGSQIWLKPGEEMTVDDLLKAAAISSANDATVCLAEYVAGSEAAFVQLMNDKARELGMQNTTFQGATGLDSDGHLTTAKDIAIMSRALLEHPLILNYSTVWMDTLRGGETQLVNTNRLVRFYQGATGLKTGTTNGAGSCLSATATRDGLGLSQLHEGAPRPAGGHPAGSGDRRGPDPGGGHLPSPRGDPGGKGEEGIHHPGCHPARVGGRPGGGGPGAGDHRRLRGRGAGGGVPHSGRGGGGADELPQGFGHPGAGAGGDGVRRRRKGGVSR